MKILLLGGTGAIGKPCGEALVKNGHEVYVTTRNQRKSEKGIYYIVGNAKEDLFVQNVLSTKWDCIIDFMNYSTKMFTSRVGSFLESTGQYIFISSSRVYSNNDEIITEGTPRLLDVVNDDDYLKTDEYALHKAREENLLFNLGKKNWTIVRPYITYNVNRLQLGATEMANWLFRSIQGRTIVFSKDIASKYTTLTYGGNVAEGIASLIGQNNALGQVFNITYNKPILWRDVLDIYLDELENYLGKRPKVKWIDKALNLQVDIAKYQVMYDRIYNRKFDTSKISHFIDVERFISPEEGLRRCLRETLKNPMMGYINTTYEAIEDKTCGEFTNLSNYPNLRLKLAYIYKRFIKI